LTSASPPSGKGFGPVTILVDVAGNEGYKRFHDLTWER
jgi:hypothetical protein